MQFLLIQFTTTEASSARLKDAIPKFRKKLSDRKIEVPDERIIFLLARKNYLPELRREFPTSKFITWIEFRMTPAKG